MAGELSGDVTIPAVGKVPKKAAAAGVAVVAFLVVIYFYRRHEAGAATTSAAAAATSTDQYPPDGTVGNPEDPYSTDPATGQTYGDESVGSGLYGADSGLSAEEAEEQLEDDEGASDSYPWDGTVGDEADPYSLDPATGQTYGDEGAATGSVPSSLTAVTTNAAWESEALTQLQAQDPSIDVDALTTALGLYLNGQPVTAAQQTLIFDATGIAGDPPVAGPAGYPRAVNTNGATGGSGSGGSETVPDCIGKSADGARQALAAVGLVPSYNEARKTGTTYTVTAQSPAAGTVVADGSTVKLTVTATGTTTTTSGGGSGGGGTGAAALVTVPVTYGESADDALAKVRAAGFTAVTSPLRNPKDTYVSTGSKPEGGTKAAKGSQVVIGVKQTS